MTQRHNRRQRKKLHLAEFQELGFTLEMHLKPDLPPEETEAFVDLFMAEIIEPRGLTFTGWSNSGFVCCYGRGSATEEDRTALLSWLRARPEVIGAEAGPLVDAWYSDEDE